MRPIRLTEKVGLTKALPPKNLLVENKELPLSKLTPDLKLEADQVPQTLVIPVEITSSEHLLLNPNNNSNKLPTPP